MKKIAFTLAAIALSATIASAADDPVATRKTLMDANNAAAAVAGAMLKGNLDYNPTVARAAIMTFRAVGHSYGSFFPAGSDKGDTKASPKIWEDMAGFQAAVAKFRSDAEAAAQTAGKDGPADLDAFKAAVLPVFDNCTNCHKEYRLQ